LLFDVNVQASQCVEKCDEQVDVCNGDGLVTCLWFVVLLLWSYFATLLQALFANVCSHATSSSVFASRA